MIPENNLAQNPHLLTHVLSYLDVRGLSLASQVNHLWQELATKNELWKSLSQAQWPDLFKKINNHSRWKSFYDKLKAFRASALQHQLTLQGHTDAINALATLPDRTLASGSWDKTILLWNTQTGECLNILMGHAGVIRTLATLPDGTLASGSHDKTIRLWNTQAGVCLNTTLKGHASVVSTLAILPNGTLASRS